ncbi:MAG: hypothetical protein ABSE36_10850 [Terracidiphilus sp.]
MLGKKPQRNHIVGLATAHGLGKHKNTLLRGAFEPSECLLEQTLHSVSAPIFFEEIRGGDLVLNEVGQVENDIATGSVKNALPGLTKLLEALHSWSLLNC